MLGDDSARLAGPSLHPSASAGWTAPMAPVGVTSSGNSTPISPCGARPPPLSIPVLRGALGVGRGPRPGQRSIARHFTRTPGIRLALLAGTARVMVSQKPLVLPCGVSAPEDDVDQGIAKTERGEVPDITGPQRLPCRKPSLRGHFCSTSQQTSFLLKRVRVGFQLH